MNGSTQYAVRHCVIVARERKGERESGSHIRAAIKMKTVSVRNLIRFPESTRCDSQCPPIHTTKCVCAFLSIFDFRTDFLSHTSSCVAVHLSGAILLVKSCKFYRWHRLCGTSAHSCANIQGERSAQALSNQSCYY